jgi:hypothetical protein
MNKYSNIGKIAPILILTSVLWSATSIAAADEAQTVQTLSCEVRNESRISSVTISIVKRVEDQQTLSYSVTNDQANHEVLDSISYADLQAQRDIQAEEIREKNRRAWRSYELQVLNGLENSFLFLPAPPAATLDATYDHEGRDSKLKIKANGMNMINLKCRSSAHTVTQTNTSKGEGKAYGAGGGSKKLTIVMKQSHQEYWCDSADVEGRLAIGNDRDLNVRCHFTGEKKF